MTNAKIGAWGCFFVAAFFCWRIAGFGWEMSLLLAVPTTPGLAFLSKLSNS
jgi:hypothetical protein